MQWLKASDQVGWYTPTSEDKANIKLLPWMIKLSGDGVFHTIQWEGDMAGKPTTFVRLHFCNLKCSRCDAWYTWKADTPEYYSEPYSVCADELTQAVLNAQKEKWLKNVVKNITITWGEPLLQQRMLEPWIKLLPDDHTDWFIQVETNWTIMPSDFMFEKCKFNCSPKLSMSWNEMKTRYWINVLKKLAEKKDTCFKFVFKTKEDIDEVLNMYDFIPLDQIWFMPEWVTKEENAEVFETTVDYILSTGCNIAIRWQNVMRDWAKRGV